jgi:glycosyltransferase involved in cell wall biosynthesis
VVIPTLNEAANLPFVLRRIPEWIDEVIIVDGLSVDETVAVARACRPDVRIVSVERHGKGHAMRAGFAEATGDIVIAMDGDGSTDPGELAAFVGALVAGADVALGSRFAVGGGTSDMEAYRKLGNHALRKLVRVFFGVPYSDLCYGYMGFWRDILSGLDGPHGGFELETMIHIRAGQCRLRVAEVPSFEARRISGTSNLRTMRDGWAVLRAIVRERFRPSHVISGELPRELRPVDIPPWVDSVDIDLTQAEREDAAQ